MITGFGFSSRQGLASNGLPVHDGFPFAGPNPGGSAGDDPTLFGSSGGGGAASDNGFNSGAGGKGGDGQIRLVWH